MSTRTVSVKTAKIDAHNKTKLTSFLILFTFHKQTYYEEADRLGIFLLPMPVIIDEQTYYEGNTGQNKSVLL